jgi:hypothetical protein
MDTTPQYIGVTSIQGQSISSAAAHAAESILYSTTLSLLIPSERVVGRHCEQLL